MGIWLSAQKCFSLVGQRMVLCGLWGWVLLSGEWEEDNKRKTTVKLGYYITKGLGYLSGKASEVFKQVRTDCPKNEHAQRKPARSADNVRSYNIQVLHIEEACDIHGGPLPAWKSAKLPLCHSVSRNNFLCLLAIKSWMPTTGEQVWTWGAGLLVCWPYIIKPFLVVKIWCPNIAWCVRWAENSYSMSCVFYVF